MFAYKKKANCLSLKEGNHPPWLRPMHGRITKSSEDCTWLYCVDCHKFLFDGDACNQRWRRAREGTPRSHIPFRDAASAAKRKTSFQAQRTQVRIADILSGKRRANCNAPDSVEADSLLLSPQTDLPNAHGAVGTMEEADPSALQKTCRLLNEV